MNSSNTCKPKMKVLLFPMTWPKIEDVGGHEAPLEASLSLFLRSLFQALVYAIIKSRWLLHAIACHPFSDCEKLFY